MSILSPAPGSQKKRHRIGRGPGSGSGKTSGKGHKGQRARSGYSRKPGFEGGQMPLSRRLPKRGFRHENRFPMHEVNLESIERHFAAGAEVTPEALVQAGVAAPCRGGVKVLARGELTKAVTVKANAVSAGARRKIEAAGGTVELIAAPTARQVAQKAAK